MKLQMFKKNFGFFYTLVDLVSQKSRRLVQLNLKKSKPDCTVRVTVQSGLPFFRFLVLQFVFHLLNLKMLTEIDCNASAGQCTLACTLTSC